MARVLLISDLDNTLYNWVDFFAPSFRAMVHALARELGIDEGELLDDFREVYGDQGSLEFSFSVQRLRACKYLNRSEVDRLARLAKTVFGLVRKKHLRPYSGVEDTLSWAWRSGVTIAGVTNAPVYHAAWRLKQLGIDQYFSGLAGWAGFEIPDDALPLVEEVSSRHREGAYPTNIPREHILALGETDLKPSEQGYLRVMRRFDIDPRSAYVVGDSLGKDVAPGQAVGATGIWARYGRKVEKKNLETLFSITHWSKSKIEDTYSEAGAVADFEIDSFEELRGIIRPPQLELIF